MDYSRAVREPCLSQMEWAPRFGSLCVAQLVKYMANHPRGVPPDSLHLIGYSVGAHIAGLVSNHLKPSEGKLGRITGLDPTIFFYSTTNSSRDLDKSDAHFVDILHTGAGILGQWSPSGSLSSVDFAWFFLSPIKSNGIGFVSRSCGFLCEWRK